MKGSYNNIEWVLLREESLDIKGDSGKNYIFTINHNRISFRESIVKRYSKYHRRIMYDNSRDSFMSSTQKDMGNHLCNVFVNNYGE